MSGSPRGIAARHLRDDARRTVVGSDMERGMAIVLGERPPEEAEQARVTVYVYAKRNGLQDEERRDLYGALGLLPHQARGGDR